MTTVSAVETDERRGESVVPEVVAIGFPLSAEQRQTMVEAMGSGYELEDIRQAPADATLVLVAPCSPQAVQALQALFPTADIVVVDPDGLPDRDSARRAISAGARDYVTTSGLGELGRRLRKLATAGWPSAATSAA